MFIPLDPALQRQLVRGWYVAWLLGYLNGLEAADGNPEPRIWSPEGWLAFPHPLLGRPVSSRRDILPALLESFPLSLLDISGGSSQTADAYRRLLQLGPTLSSPDGAAGGVTELAQWLQSGQRPRDYDIPPINKWLQERAEELPRPGTGGPDGSPRSAAEARRRAAEEALAAQHAAYEQVRDMIPDPKEYVPDRRWEAAPLVLASLDQLLRYVREVPLPDTVEPSVPGPPIV